MIRSLTCLLTLIMALFAGCKTPGGAMKTSSVYDGGAPTKVNADVGESSDEQCGRFGGEMIDGECICADGTPKSKISGATHCSAWIKKKYPDCYAKGGMPKAYGKTSEALCVCSYGEALKSGSDSCYDQFKAKYADCAEKGGIVLADDSICRCLHGKPALKLSGTCEDDFEKENESCARKLGVTSQGSACRCRDGRIVDADEKVTCGDPWFFYSKKATASTSTTPTGDSASGSAQGDGDTGSGSGSSSGTGNKNSRMLGRVIAARPSRRPAENRCPRSNSHNPHRAAGTISVSTRSSPSKKMSGP